MLKSKWGPQESPIRAYEGQSIHLERAHKQRREKKDSDKNALDAPRLIHGVLRQRETQVSTPCLHQIIFFGLFISPPTTINTALLREIKVHSSL